MLNSSLSKLKDQILLIEFQIKIEVILLIGRCSLQCHLLNVLDRLNFNNLGHHLKINEVLFQLIILN